MNIYIDIAIALFYFASTVTAYALGVKHGRIVRNDGQIELNPKKIIASKKQEKEAMEQVDQLTKGLQNILSFGDESKVNKQ